MKSSLLRVRLLGAATARTLVAGLIFGGTMAGIDGAMAAHCLEQAESRAPAVLHLAENVSAPSLVLRSEALIVSISQADLLAFVSQRDPEGKSSFVQALRSVLPSAGKLTTSELLERITPAVPDHPENTRSDEWRHYRRESRDLHSSLMSAIAQLIDRGRAAARDPLTNDIVQSVERAESRDCIGYRAYRTPDGEDFLVLEGPIP